MITVALDRGSGLLAQILLSKTFGVNVLSIQQEETARIFATRGADRFALTAMGFPCGLPRLRGAASWLACELAQAVEGGDHILLLGLVTEAEKTSATPLVYSERLFGAHSGLLEREAARAQK